jgi:hypothetical protein
LNPTAEGGYPVSLALRTTEGLILDRSGGFAAEDSVQMSLALQCFRFIDGDMFYDDSQLLLLLRATQMNKEVVRRSFFENVMRCRRRDRRRWNDTPLAKLFSSPDEFHLMSFRAKVARIRWAIQQKGWKELREAFYRFNKMGDGLLSKTELTVALEELQLPGFDSSDVAELVLHADTNEDELIDLKEFTALFRDPDTKDIEKLKENPEVTDVVRGKRVVVALPAHLQALALAEEQERLKRIEAREARKRQAYEQKATRDKQKREEEARQKLREAQFLETQALRQAVATTWTCLTCFNEFNPISAKQCTVCEAKRPPQAGSPEDESVEPVFWDCSACTTENARERPFCSVCQTKKPLKKAKVVQLQLWACSVCKRLVDASNKECDVCQTQNPTAKK